MNGILLNQSGSTNVIQQSITQLDNNINDITTTLGTKGDKEDVYTELGKKADKTDINTALERKVDKDGRKVLSDNNYTTDEKTKLSGIAAGAEVNAINSIKVNGTTQTISTDDRSVNITLPAATWAAVKGNASGVTSRGNYSANDSVLTILNKLINNATTAIIDGGEY